MVNLNDLNELNRLGFGADVDKLESYTIHLKQCKNLGIEYVNEYEYTRCLNLLKKLKPESVVFIGNWDDECEELNEYDAILREKMMKPLKIVFSMDGLETLREFISSSDYENSDNIVDVYANARYVGMEVRVVYSHGHLVSGSVQSKFLKGKDITSVVKRSNIPKNISEWKGIEIVELRGIVTISKDNYCEMSEEFMTLLHSITYLVKDEANITDIGKISFVFNEILIREDEKHKLEIENKRSAVVDYLDDIGFITPERAIIRDVDYYSFSESMQNIIDYFNNLDTNDSIGYDIVGIDIYLDNMEISNQAGYRKDGVTLGIMNNMSSKTYSAIVKSIWWKDGVQYMIPMIEIERTITVDGDIVDNVIATDVSCIEKCGIYAGEEIKFKHSKCTGAILYIE